MADRWHLIHNLAEALALVLESYQAQLRNASEALAPPSLKKAEPLASDQEEALSPEESAPPLVASGPPYRTPVIQRLQQDRRERRFARYEQMVTLQQLGMTTASIARLPEAGRQAAKTRTRTRKKEASGSGVSHHFLTKRAAGLLLRRSTELTSHEQETVQMLCQIHPKVETAYQLVQDFLAMLTSHQAEWLDTWLATVESCGIAAFERLGRGIEQDYEAVVAGLTLSYSNGVVEGHVNR